VTSTYWRTHNPIVVSDEVFDHVSDTVTPAGILAIFKRPRVQAPAATAPLVLVVAGVRDPGNVGTLIRSAAGAGATSVAVVSGSVDPFNSKAVRAGMGGHFRVPVSMVSPDELSLQLADTEDIVIADGDASLPYDEVDYTRPVALVIGSEATGVDASFGTVATKRVAIPLERDLDSLNAGIAGAILLFEASRQRRVANV
jgi:RNA methyltransferase, TrmH family